MAKKKLEEARKRWGEAAIVNGVSDQKPPTPPKQVPQSSADSPGPPAA